MISPLGAPGSKLNPENSFFRLSLLETVPKILNHESKFCTAIEVSAEDTKLSITPSDDNTIDKLYKRVELEIRGNEPAVIKSYVRFSTVAASHLGVEIEKSWPLRKSLKERYTLLKSVFSQKRHRVQYELRTYYHFMHLVRVTGSTCETLLEYLERNLPEGVAMKVAKVEIQKLPDYLKPPTKKSET